jgi:hypothetical protein
MGSPPRIAPHVPSFVDTLESYYCLSGAHEIYTFPTTVFSFGKQFNRMSIKPMLQRFHIHQHSIASADHLLPHSVDVFHPVDPFRHGTSKSADNSREKLIKYSLKNREEVVGELKVTPQQISPLMLGQDLVGLNLVDGYGSYHQILKQKHPKSIFLKFYGGNEHLPILKFLTILTSPILLTIFLIKVVIKWSLILYIWIKATSPKAETAAETPKVTGQAEQK